MNKLEELANEIAFLNNSDMHFVLGTIFGIIVSTIGFAGVARILDKAVDVTKAQAEKAAK